MYVWADVCSGSLFTVDVFFSKKAIKDIESSGRICILDIDMQGVRSVKKTDLKPVFIFVKPPDNESLVSFVTATLLLHSFILFISASLLYSKFYIIRS